MTLFESPSQFREKATICRMFELLPLYAPLAEGHVFRWFALNIPMDLGTGGSFTSDIDIIACLLPYPASAHLQPYPRPKGGLIYKTWEVKVSLIHKDGTARSLKSGKTRSTMKQLRAYRNFGSPVVSLLDVYLCEADFMRGNTFPPEPVQLTVNAKIQELRDNEFGYQILPFEHSQDGDIDVGLMTYRNPTLYGSPSSNFRLLPVTRSEPIEGFARLMERLNACYYKEVESLPKEKGRGFSSIVFCRSCRQLSLTRMKDASLCPRCREDLRFQ